MEGFLVVRQCLSIDGKKVRICLPELLLGLVSPHEESARRWKLGGE